jgi:uncharacterized protein (DUF1330 family)
MRFAHASRGIRQGRPMSFPPANFDPSIDPRGDQVRALRDAGPDGPVMMLNLLKFREQANYPAGSPHAPCSGAEAYRRYQTAFVETVGDVSRAEVVWEGQVDRTFIGDATQEWDKCLLVRYPSRQHFLAMMANAAYREALVHRYAGLERTILLQMQG